MGTRAMLYRLCPILVAFTSGAILDRIIDTHPVHLLGHIVLGTIFGTLVALVGWWRNEMEIAETQKGWTRII